jgi:hypothetical protein
MLEWLLTPIDPVRAHEVGFAVSWHARLMTVAWGVLAPIAVVAARYLKVMPGQDWPRELDNKTWWHCHWMGQVLAYALSLIGLGLILGGGASDGVNALLHQWLGYSVLALATLQVLLGVFRGTKGGPTARATDGSLTGDHYDMTPWRLKFELLHRVFGYFALLIAAAAIVSGLWYANAPRWMWIVIANWWVALLILSAVLQRRGFAFDTYQAIWGPDPGLPGNRIPKTGWGTRREDHAMNSISKEGAE